MINRPLLAVCERGHCGITRSGDRFLDSGSQNGAPEGAALAVDIRLCSGLAFGLPFGRPPARFKSPELPRLCFAVLQNSKPDKSPSTVRFDTPSVEAMQSASMSVCPHRNLT